MSKNRDPYNPWNWFGRLRLDTAPLYRTSQFLRAHSRFYAAHEEPIQRALESLDEKLASSGRLQMGGWTELKKLDSIPEEKE